MGDGMSIDKALVDEVTWTQPELPFEHDPSCTPNPPTVYHDEDCTGCWCHEAPLSVLNRNVEATMEDLRAAILKRGHTSLVIPGVHVHIDYR